MLTGEATRETRLGRSRPVGWWGASKRPLVGWSGVGWAWPSGAEARRCLPSVDERR